MPARLRTLRKIVKGERKCLNHAYCTERISVVANASKSRKRFGAVVRSFPIVKRSSGCISQTDQTGPVA